MRKEISLNSLVEKVTYEKLEEERLKSLRGIVSDVDGTLRQSGTDNGASKRVLRAVDNWRKTRGPENSHFSIITNSPKPKVDGLIKSLDLKGPQSTSGGAEIIEAETGRLINNYPLNIGVVRDLCREIIYPVQGNGGRLWIQDDGLDYDPLSPNYKAKNPYIIVIDAINEEYANTLIEVFKKNNDIAAHRVILPPGQDHLAGIHITHPNATKYHAIMEISDIINIPLKNLLGIGDGPNDVPLFEACGIKTAVRKDDGTIEKKLEALADYIVPSMNNDGVAVMLEYLIKFFKINMDSTPCPKSK